MSNNSRKQSYVDRESWQELTVKSRKKVVNLSSCLDVTFTIDQMGRLVWEKLSYLEVQITHVIVAKLKYISMWGYMRH